MLWVMTLLAPGRFTRARVFFAAHGINELDRIDTDNGNNYRARNFARTVEELAAGISGSARTPRGITARSSATSGC